MLLYQSGGGEAQKEARVARVQGAEHDIVHVGRVLERDELARGAKPDGGQRIAGILDQRPPEHGVSPGIGDDTTVGGRARRIRPLDHAAQAVGGDNPLLDQQLAHRLLEQHVFARPFLARRGVLVPMVMVV